MMMIMILGILSLNSFSGSTSTTKQSIENIFLNEEKVTVAGCSTGSKEFLRQKVDKNEANNHCGVSFLVQ